MTVAELLHSITAYEFEMWKIYDTAKAKLEEDAAKKARRKR